MKPRPRAMALSAASTLLAFTVATAAGPVSEDRVKAVFLFNFTRFVEWPEEELPKRGKPFSICTLGETPLDDFLEEAVRGESVLGRPLEHSVLGETIAPDHCQVVFFDQNDDERLRGALSMLRGRSVLTVGESPAFRDAGGMIRFRIAERRVRFEIDSDAAKDAKLRISSQLLKLALPKDS